MLDIFLKTLPFFAILGLGYFAAWRGFFSEQATAHLTKFVFYFALSAMIFHFAARLSLTEVFHGPSVLAYFAATLAVYVLVTVVALVRGVGMEEAIIEAQSAAIGNVGFLGIPMLVLLMGSQAIGPVMIVLAIDLFVFGSLLVIVVSAKRDGRMSVAVLGSIALGLVKNPMIMAIAMGLLWAGLNIPIPQPLGEFLTLLAPLPPLVHCLLLVLRLPANRLSANPSRFGFLQPNWPCIRWPLPLLRLCCLTFRPSQLRL